MRWWRSRVAEAKKQHFPTGYPKTHDKEKVKSNAPGAGDPEAPVTYFKFSAQKWDRC